MLTVIETPIFQRMVRDVIPGPGDLRKVRWSRPGMGKRGGARVIYFNRLASGQVVLVATYTKAKFDNMPAAVLKMWKEAYDGRSQDGC